MVHVRTGDRKGAGTDANVFIILEDVDGKRTPETKLDKLLHNDHERGQTCTYQIYTAQGFKEIVRIELWRDDHGFGADWYVDLIHVEHQKLNSSHSFPIQRWINANVKYQFAEHDCHLPHKDPHLEQRKRELTHKKKEYAYVITIPDGPAQIQNLPSDETFSDNYKWDLVTLKAKLMLNKAYVNWKTDGAWESLEQMKQVFQYTVGEEPDCLDHWDQDWFFGIQRIQGCNPILIELCKAIPESFGVTDEMVRPFLEGLTLQEALDSNKIFIVDLGILDKLKYSTGRAICTPFALFFLDDHQELMPIAIQLFQQKSPNNPVFLPSDPKYTWLLVKIFYNNADASYHQSLTHLGFTHLMMEGVVICTHRNLAPSHPLFRLLAPHFLFLLAINSRALEKLVSPGGWVDNTMTLGRDGMFHLVSKNLNNNWRLDIEGTIPKQIEKRGVLDESILPYYPYRDDAISVYNAVKKYVTKMVHHYYASDDDIRKDYELQTWRKELTSPRTEGGVGMLGVAGSDEEGFTKAEEIAEVLTSIISICSISHAAANFPQYDEYSFLPNYPGLLIGEPPADKNELTEADIMQHIPTKEIALDIMVITKLLSSKGTKSLGDFEVQYLYDPIGLDAAHEFRQDLEEISAEIEEKNKKRRLPYPWLDPKTIPNAISI